MKKGFLLDSEGKDHFVLKHSDGHMLKVAKGGISPEVTKVIQSLACGGKVQGYAGGGKVKDRLTEASAGFVDPYAVVSQPQEEQPQMPSEPETVFDPLAPFKKGFSAAKTAVQPIGELGDAIGGGIRSGIGNLFSSPNPNYVPPSPTQSAQPAPPPQYGSGPLGLPEQSAPQPMPIQPQQQATPGQDINKMAMSGLQKEAQAVGQQGQMQAEAINKEMEQYNKIKSQLDANIQETQGRMNQISDEIANHQMDPNRAWKNRSTGGKITALIGMVLGGYGGANNPALKIIDREIENDIRSQELELGSKKTLLQNYMSQYGNLKDAKEALRLDMGAMVQAQMSMIAGKMAGPIAQARAEQQKALWMQQAAPKIQNLEMKRAVRDHLAQPGVSPEEANRIFDYASSVDKDWAKGLKEEYSSVTEIDERRRNIETSLSNLEGMISKKGTYEVLGSHNADMDRIVEQIATDMAKLQDPQSIARPSEVEAVKKHLVSSGLTMRNETALQILKNFRGEVTSRAQQAYKVRGLRPPAAAPVSTQPKATKGFAQK